ncbi:MAG: DUF2231 domain-containing protein [Bacteroidota bacterium]
MSVHFPIALSITAAGCYLYGLVQKDAAAWKGGYVLHIVATISSLIAILTGRSSRGDLELTPTLESLLQTHELTGYLLIWLLAMLLIWQYLRIRKMTRSEKGIFLLLYMLVLGILTYGSWIGGKMVYEEGAGVVPIEQQLSP